MAIFPRSVFCLGQETPIDWEAKACYTQPGQAPRNLNIYSMESISEEGSLG